MSEEKRGRGRPKGAPNKPLMELQTERKRLTQNADVFEILCQANIVAGESEDNAINGLRVFNQRNGAVKSVLMWVFSDNIVSRLPEGKTPYTPNVAPASDLAENALRFEAKNFKYYVTDQLSSNRREMMWIRLLESVNKNESELMDLVKDKKWPFKNITKSIAKKAFPEIQ